MAMLAVLLNADQGEVTVGSRAVSRLAHLGVTSVALLGDERTNCIVLEGWAFDPESSVSDVVSAIADDTRSIRALQLVMQIAVEGVSRTGEAEKSSPLISASPLISEGGKS